MRRAAVLFPVTLLAGCDFLFQLQHIDPIDGGAAEDARVPGCGPNNLLHSGFSDDVELARSWDKVTAPTTSLQIVDHTLAVTVGVPDGYAYAVSNKLYDVRGGTVQARLVEPFMAPNSEMFVEMRAPTTDQPRCFVGIDQSPDGVLQVGFRCKSDTSEPIDGLYLPFDPVAHRWLRMQIVGASGGTAVVFSTSADGANWTQRSQLATTYDFSSAAFHLGGGSYLPGGVAMPYTVRYDDFDFCGP